MQRKELAKLGYDFDYLLKYQCNLVKMRDALEEHNQKFKNNLHTITAKKQKLESIKQEFEESKELFEQMKQINYKESGISSRVYIGYETSSSKPVISFDKTCWWHNGKRILYIENKFQFDAIKNISIYNKPDVNDNLIELIEKQTKSLQILDTKITDCDKQIQNFKKRYHNFLNQKYHNEKKIIEDELTDINMLFLQPDLIPMSRIFLFERKNDDFFHPSIFFSHQSSSKRKQSEQNLESEQETQPQNKKPKLT